MNPSRYFWILWFLVVGVWAQAPFSLHFLRESILPPEGVDRYTVYYTPTELLRVGAVRRSVDQLGHRIFFERESPFQAMQTIGWRLLELLSPFAEHSDAEVRKRIKELTE